MRFRQGALIFFITISLSEIASRWLISRNFNTPIWQPSDIIYTFYPELLSLPHNLRTDKINILILGGSAITDTLCHTSKNVERELTDMGMRVKVYNLARFAHTTFDSKVKFKHCGQLGFDYVFVYNGINDTRANNCPANIFMDDYSHIHFYSQVNIFERHSELKYFILPFVLDYYWNELKIKAGWKKTIPKEYFVMNPKLTGIDPLTKTNATDENTKSIKKFLLEHRDKVLGSDRMEVDSSWWEEGRNIKSVKSFRNNLMYIYDNKPNKTKLILTDYAWYQPDDYSLQKFLYGKMDYAEQRWPTEIYGKSENVAKGITKHNKIIESITQTNTDILYFNFNDSIPHTGTYFNDICHLADSGQLLLSHILSREISRH
jgi:hypothetical protein